MIIDTSKTKFTHFIDDKGNEYRYQEGKLHSVGDLPAMIQDGTKKWYQVGKLHRDNYLPAVIQSDGTKKWYQGG